MQFKIEINFDDLQIVGESESEGTG